MPIYEYHCQSCETIIEELQKIADAPLKKCPECGKLKLRKLVSAPGFRLSGTGWYETDFKSDGDKKRNLSTKDSEKKVDSKSDKGKNLQKKSESGKTDKKVSSQSPKKSTSSRPSGGNPASGSN